MNKNNVALTFYCQNVWNNNRYGNRTILMNELVREYSSDVLLFQEFGHRSIRKGDYPLDKLLSDEYTEVSVEAGEFNFTPVFYKSSRFDCVDSGYILYKGKNDSNSKSLTWAILKEKESGVLFGAGSTHFWWKNDEPDDNACRLSNAKEFADCILALKEKYNIPLVAGGDLNCGYKAGQGEEPYFAVKERLLDARDISKVTTDNLTHHAYPVLHEDGHFTEGPHPTRNLDHLFVTEHENISCESFSVDISPKALSTSDHCPLILKAKISN